jgi:sirohydrochlorin ferrochelatase
MSTALLLIAHGSRRAEANADLEHLAGELRRRGPFAPVVCSYLELAEPDIVTGGARCVAAGAAEVRLLPYFLSAGVHVTRDLEEACRQLREQFPAVRFTLCPPIGRHPLMTAVVLDRAGAGS